MHWPSVCNWRLEAQFIAQYTVGYGDFNNLILPGRWWLQNLIIRHGCKKVLGCFVRVWLQSLPKVHIFLQKCNMGIQKRRFDADFASVEKVAKTSCKFINENDRKMEIFTFIIVCKCFGKNNFFWGKLFAFFYQILSRHQTLCFMVPI